MPDFIHIHPDDNVAVALRAIPAGTCFAGRSTLSSPVSSVGSPTGFSSVSSSTSVVEKLPTPVLISDDGISYTWENTSFTKGYIYELNGEKLVLATARTSAYKKEKSLKKTEKVSLFFEKTEKFFKKQNSHPHGIIFYPLCQ